MLTCVSPGLEKVIVDLTRAENYLFHRGGIDSCYWTIVRNQPLELRVWCHFVKAGPALRMSEQTLGCHDHQWLAEGKLNLPCKQNIHVSLQKSSTKVATHTPKDVEIGCWSGAIGHNHVDVGELLDSEFILQRWEILWIISTKLKESFRSGRRVFRTHAFHSMGQEHDKSGLTDPFGLTTGDELVNDTLGRVRKVAKLGLPQNQSIGVSH